MQAPPHPDDLAQQFRRLPRELQEAVMRRARFLEARARVERWLSRRAGAGVRTSPWRNGHVVVLPVSATKTVNIEHITWDAASGHERHDCIIVDVCDYSALAAFVDVLEQQGRIELRLGVERTTRYIMDNAAAPRAPRVQWCWRDRRENTFQTPTAAGHHS
jgi:hypothetical protein